MAAKMDEEENHLEWKEAETNSDSIHDLYVTFLFMFGTNSISNLPFQCCINRG